MSGAGARRLPGIVVLGTGAALPERVVTNHDLAAVLDTSDEWIRERTGISSRRIGGTTTGLAVDAGRRALDVAGLAPCDVGLLVLATTTPDRQIPASAAAVQEGLGLRCGSFDLNAACAGFAYAVSVAASMAPAFGDVLVIGSETLSRVTDQDDRQTAVLMADGAGAAVVRSDPGADDVVVDLGVDGSLTELLYAEHGGHMQMNGREVFRNAVRVTVASACRVLEEARLGVADVALLVPHQANLRITSAVAERLGIPAERCASTIGWTGNTSAASVPIALDHAVREGRVHRGDAVLLAGFGAGMTWGSALLRW